MVAVGGEGEGAGLELIRIASARPGALLKAVTAENVNRDGLLIAMVVAGSALCWWPAAIEPSIDFSRWILLAVTALITGLSTALSGRQWMRFATWSAIGVFVGLWSSLVIFPSSDGIAASYAPIIISLVTLATLLVSLLAGLTGRLLTVSGKKARRAVWLALLCCVAFGPVALALTRPLVAHRVARNDRIAAERFKSLQSAVEGTIATSGDPERICDGEALRQHYSGPPFSNDDWNRIAGNYVKQDGYVFMVYCHENPGYRIEAMPARGKADGTQRFCTERPSDRCPKMF